MKKLFSLVVMGAALSGCTMSINLANTRGESVDAIDSSPSQPIEVSPTVSVPASIVGV